MESRNPLAETACSVGFVHLILPTLALHLVDDINKRIGFHGITVSKGGFNGRVQRFGSGSWWSVG